MYSEILLSQSESPFQIVPSPESIVVLLDNPSGRKDYVKVVGYKDKVWFNVFAKFFGFSREQPKSQVALHLCDSKGDSLYVKKNFWYENSFQKKYALESSKDVIKLSMFFESS